MGFSRFAARVAALVVLAGCAHARPASVTAAPSPARAGGSAAAGAQTPSGALEGRLDPSEEITPEELARIPDPVPPDVAPRVAVTAPPTPVEAPSKAPPGAPETPPTAAGTPSPTKPDSSLQTPPPGPPGSWTWMVQILATPDRALAARVGREASDRLGTTFRVDAEGELSKVRLGAFRSEADAQILRSRAVEMGYPGAFRVKIRRPRTDG